MSEHPVSDAVTQADPWTQLRELTPARIALGRTGTSLPTAAQLDFQFAHAQARDAVHLPFDPSPIEAMLAQARHPALTLRSAAADRTRYLQRPDLGRRLDQASSDMLRAHAALRGNVCDVVIVVADGLSALAVHRHAPPMLERLLAHANARHWSLAPVCLVAQGRVAIGDEIGELLGARLCLTLIGERPGLSSPDSLGAYLTWSPRIGLTDAARNCISNIRLAGLSYDTALRKLAWLMEQARQRQLTGVQLKDEVQRELPTDARTTMGNFLLPE
jgi:ethanolamine ammonia-lyase small subunit